MTANQLGPKSKIYHGSLMSNIDVNMCDKFHYNRSRNDRALGDGKSEQQEPQQKNKNVCGHWGPVSGFLVGIISISQYRDINRQPHMATISYDRLRLPYDMG